MKCETILNLPIRTPKSEDFASSNSCLRWQRQEFKLGLFVSMMCKLSFLVAQPVKNLPAVWDTWVQSLGWEDPLEEGLTTHFSILAWRIPKDRGAWWATVHGVAQSRT